MFVLNACGHPVIIQTQGTQGGVRNEQQVRDALGRLLRSDTQHSTRTFSYNRLDQITEVVLTPTEEGERLHHMPADRVCFAYDRSGWLTAEHSVYGSIRYRRDALGNPTDITLPDGQHISHLYYGSGHLLQTALDGITVSEYERDSLHRQVMRSQGALTTFSGYNADNRLSWQRSLLSGSHPRQQTAPPAQHDSVMARDYIWNGDGEVGGINDKLRGCLVFSYDRSGWLTSRTGQMYDHDHWYYDKAGNLLTGEHQSAVIDNRLPGYGRDRYRYNEWGELSERRGQQLEWNAQGQLTRVISSNSETRYQYDAFGRRTAKRCVIRAAWKRHQHAIREVRYQWLGMALSVSEKRYADGSPALREQWHYRGVFELLAKESRAANDDISHFYPIVTGPDGAPQEMYSASSRKVWTKSRSLWGLPAANVSPDNERESCDAGFAGQWQDEESGLWYNLHRYYDAGTGQYLSQDPLKLAGGLNTQSYVHDPVGWCDPVGLTSCQLSAAMEKNGTPRPANSAAHHIVPETAKGAQPARDILSKHGIDINGPDNGVFLPNRNNTDGMPGILHSEKHPDKYLDAINKRIRVADITGGKQGVLDELSNISDVLSGANRSASWYNIL